MHIYIETQTNMNIFALEVHTDMITYVDSSLGLFPYIDSFPVTLYSWTIIY